jgi:hypothetical protein
MNASRRRRNAMRKTLEPGVAEINAGGLTRAGHVDFIDRRRITSAPQKE